MLLWGSFRCSEVHFDKFKMFMMCDLATDCIKVQLPTEMASVTSLALATPGARGGVPGWSGQAELDAKHFSLMK